MNVEADSGNCETNASYNDVSDSLERRKNLRKIYLTLKLVATWFLRGLNGQVMQGRDSQNFLGKFIRFSVTLGLKILRLY